MICLKYLKQALQNENVLTFLFSYFILLSFAFIWFLFFLASKFWIFWKGMFCCISILTRTSAWIWTEKMEILKVL
ncbi:unnamed protein product [Blepharisma stoltei]|uniref:Uncharacterized protein n=1 Tax=Blepharisma stoltei TaxID=1481888 RepID=A0AAU9IV52_9CILI|nr:unnamed protein product [Blepharisma stoltei]